MGFAALMNVADDQQPWTQDSRVLACIIKPLLDASVIGNRLYLRLFPNTPPLYRAGVHYQEEPPTYVTFADGRKVVVEEFASLPIVYKRHWGDCDDLAPIRIAELLNRGEKASLRVQWRKQPSGRKLYHILLRRPAGVSDFDPRFMVRAPDGTVLEDPSRALGMPSTIAGMIRDASLTLDLSYPLALPA